MLLIYDHPGVSSLTNKHNAQTLRSYYLRVPEHLSKFVFNIPIGPMFNYPSTITTTKCTLSWRYLLNKYFLSYFFFTIMRCKIPDVFHKKYIKKNARAAEHLQLCTIWSTCFSQCYYTLCLVHSAGLKKIIKWCQFSDFHTEILFFFFCFNMGVLWLCYGLL